jgi:hypothetical protein
MNRSRFQLILYLAALLAVAASAQAQQRPLTPHIGYVYPAGGRQGATVTVTVGGQALVSPSAAWVSGQGVQVTVGTYSRPMTNREVILLRDKLDEAFKKLQNDPQISNARGGLRNPMVFMRVAKEAGVSEEQLRALNEFRRRQSDPKRQLNPQLDEQVTLQIKIDPQAAPGNREIRLLTALGLSNPICFRVGKLPEFLESEPNDKAPDTCITEPLPAAVNGQITPGDVDRFAFTARKGTRLVCAAAARQLIPYLADAVPGWFEATLALYNAKGQELAYAAGKGSGALLDPALYYEVPEDGQYIVEIKDALYRGREDFVYRITIGEVPFVTSLFPLGGRAGAAVTVDVNGWNLTERKLTVDTKNMEVGIHQVSAAVAQASRLPADILSALLRLPFAVDTLPEGLENEPNDESATPLARNVGEGSGVRATARAQRVNLPIIVNGRIDRPGDVDVFRFEGRAGQEVVAEVYARRLGFPLDSSLELTDASGQVAFNDDFEDTGAGLTTHHADSYIRTKLPRTGTYFLTLRDAQHHGGAECAYRLRLSPPQPDFQLRIVPSSLVARAGTAVPMTVYALRRDGFDGDIDLALKDAPPGFTLSGGRVPGNQDQVRLTLTVATNRPLEPVRLQMEGRAVIAGREVRRTALAVEDMMQAFAYHHLAPAEDWVVAVMGRAAAGPAIRLTEDKTIRIPAGGTVRVPLFVPNWLQPNQIQFALNEPPEGISLQSVSAEGGGLAIVLRADAAKVKPGVQGNLIVDAFRTGGAGFQPANNRNRRAPIGTLPAIPFEVVQP